MAITVGKTFFWWGTLRPELFAAIPSCIRGLIARRRLRVAPLLCGDAGQFKMRNPSGAVGNTQSILRRIVTAPSHE